MSKLVEPRIPTGFMELLPQDQILFNRMYDTIRRVYERFGFLPLDTTTIELSEVLLAKAGGETEKQIYRFTKGDHDLALRFDLTVPLARYVSQHQQELVFPFKRYQMSKVFRGERPQKGRFREFYQCDIDIIGQDELSLFYDAEMPVVIYHVFKELDLAAFTIRLNNRKVLGGFFKGIGLEDKTTDVLRIIDKLEKIGRENVTAELLDDGISEENIDKIFRLVSIKGSNDEILEQLKGLGIEDETFKEGVSELDQVVSNMRLLGMPEENFEIDLTIARGLDYYTGTVSESRLNDYPQFGSVCSGGRYENLTGFYSKTKMPGIGISIGLTRMFSQLKEAGLLKADTKTLVKALVVPMSSDQMKEALQTASVLRQAQIPTDVYYQQKGMKQKMKYASRLGIPYVVLIGEDEAKQGKVAVKDMTESTQTVVTALEAARLIAGKK